MKISKLIKVVVCTISTMVLFGGASAFATDQTARKQIGSLKVSGSDGYYYFVSTDNSWGGSGCPNALYV